MKLLTAILLTAMTGAYLAYFVLVCVYVWNEPMWETQIVLGLSAFAVPPCIYAAVTSCRRAFTRQPIDTSSAFS
jgi:hypothetical protein